MSKIANNGEYLSQAVFGTTNYIAPESYDLCIYTFKSDIWSLGIVFYVLITKKFPYDIPLRINNSHSNLYRRNEFKHPDLTMLKKSLKNNQYCDKLCELLSHMIEFNLDTRYEPDKLISVIENILSKNIIS